MKQIKILFLTKNPEKIVSILDNELAHCEKIKIKNGYYFKNSFLIIQIESFVFESKKGRYDIIYLDEKDWSEREKEIIKLCYFPSIVSRIIKIN